MIDRKLIKLETVRELPKLKGFPKRTLATHTRRSVDAARAKRRWIWTEK